MHHQIPRNLNLSHEKTDVHPRHCFSGIHVRQAQKQLGGEHNVEVSFNPFADNPIDASVIKYRKFLDDDAALRVTLGLNNTSNSYLVVPENDLFKKQASQVRLRTLTCS